MVRVPRAISNASRGVSFKRSFFVENWGFSPAATSGFWKKLAPSFTDLPNSSEYLVLFDMYKVNGIKVTFHPRNSLVQAPDNQSAGVYNNQFYITYAAETEHDYSLIPTGTYGASNYNSFLEKMGSKVRTKPMTKPVSLYFKPRVIDDLGGGINMKRCPWLNTSMASTILYGAHVWLHDYAFGALNNQQFGVDIQYTFYFQCKGYN